MAPNHLQPHHFCRLCPALPEIRRLAREFVNNHLLGINFRIPAFDVSIDDDIDTPPLHFLPASLTPPHSSDISGCRGTKAMSVMSASIHSPCLPSPSQTANLSHCTEAQLQLKLVCCHVCVYVAAKVCKKRESEVVHQCRCSCNCRKPWEIDILGSAFSHQNQVLFFARLSSGQW